MQIHTGDLFTSSAAYLGHGVNLRGMMGAGIAKTFRERYPINYAEYKKACAYGTLSLGDVLVIPEREENNRLRLITNLATQDLPGPNAEYKAVFGSLFSWAEKASRPERLSKFGGIMAIPEIGCGIGGLELPKVKAIVKAVEYCFPDIEFEMWHYEA